MLDFYVYPFLTGNMKITGAFYVLYMTTTLLHSHGVDPFPLFHATIEGILLAFTEIDLYDIPFHTLMLQSFVEEHF